VFVFLLSGHRSFVQSVNLDCFLGKRTQTAEPDEQEIVATGAIDALLLPHKSTDLCEADDICDGHEHETALEAAGLTDLLGDLPFDVTGQEVDADADRTVVETAEQLLFELTRHLFTVCF
jgi:hypothetical protein